MIFGSSGLSFAVNGVDVTVKIGVIILVDSAEPFGNLIFFRRPRGIENAEFLAVGGDQGDVMSAFGKKTD
jgi:hypothetical protein